MACNEPDDKAELLDEIRILEDQIASLEEQRYLLISKSQLLQHRVDDLKYYLRTGIDPRKP